MKKTLAVMKTIMFFLILPLILAFIVIVPALWLWYKIVEWYRAVKPQAKVIDINTPVESNKIEWEGIIP